MTEEQAAHVTDPFFTTRKTRKVGLGIPFFKYAAESTGGSFTIDSTPGAGTTVTAVFGLSHIDRMPLGDMNSTIETLITCHPDTDFLYTYRYNDASFVLDTREFREILGDIPFDTPEVLSLIHIYCVLRFTALGGRFYSNFHSENFEIPEACTAEGIH